MSILTAIQESFQSSPRRVPSEVALATVSNDRGRVGKSSVRLFRNWSEHSEWVRAAINIRKTQVSGAEWDIAPINPDIKSDPGLQQEIKDRLYLANPKDEEFGTFIEKVVEDIMVLDAGSIEIERMLRGEPLFAHSVDGGEVKISRLWDGTDPDEKRYFWYPDNFERGSWTNDDFIYIMETPRTNSVVGLSKLETLKLSIDSELEGHSYNSRQVRNAAPDGLLHLGKGAKQDNIDAFRAFWQAEQGRGTLAITGGTELPGFIKFHDTNHDMQFMEWQIYLVRKICAVFGLDASDLGFGQDINRSTAEVKDQQGEDRGIRPLMGRVAWRLTRGFVQDEAFGGPANNLGFRWTKLNLKESLARAKINQLRTAGMPNATVNQVRKENGDEPLGPEYDELMMVTPQGAFRVTDLPTVREFMDSKVPKPAPSGAVAKSEDPEAVDDA